MGKIIIEDKEQHRDMLKDTLEYETFVNNVYDHLEAGKPYQIKVTGDIFKFSDNDDKPLGEIIMPKSFMLNQLLETLSEIETKISDINDAYIEFNKK